MAWSRRKRRVALLLVGFYAVATLVGRWRGYRFGPNTIVRCRRGHLSTSIWIPGVSLKSIRLGWWRIQRCPVGPHWSIVVPVRDADLTEAEQQLAAEQRDIRIP
jgi:hypothetical protein